MLTGKETINSKLRVKLIVRQLNAQRLVKKKVQGKEGCKKNVYETKQTP